MVALAEQQWLQRSKLASSQSFSAQVCSDNAVQVSFLNKQMISLKEQLTAANAAARSANTEKKIMQSKLKKLNSSVEKFAEEKRLLQEINQQLESDL